MSQTKNELEGEILVPPVPAAAAPSFFAKLRSNRVFVQTIQINTMRAVALGIGFVGSVWSSRCLGPEKLGISGLVIGTITPLVLLVNLNQTAHFVRLYRGREQEADRAELVTIVSTFKIAVSLGVMLLALPLLLFGHFSPQWYVALAAGFPYFFLLANAADWLLQSEEKIPASTMAVALQAVLTTCFYFAFFRPGIFAGADLIVQDVALFAASLFAWYAALRGRRLHLFKWSKIRQIVPILVEGRWLIATGIAVYIFTAMELPLVGWLYSLKELGIYRTSWALVAGIQAFTNYIPMLLYPRMIEWNKEGPHRLWQGQKRIISFFALFTLVMSSMAFLLAPFGYHLLYGAPFQRGAYPFAILLTAKMMSVISGILTWGMMAQRRDRSLFRIMMCVATFSIVSNILFIPRFGAYAASTTNLLSELLMFSLICRLVRRSLRT